MRLVLMLSQRVAYYYYKLRKRKIPDAHHVARYIGGSKFEHDKRAKKDVIVSAAFKCRKDARTGERQEDDLSVNWLEFFNKHADNRENIKHVREVFSDKSFDVGATAKFSVLNVGSALEAVRQGTKEQGELVSLIAKHTPDIDDASHSSIFGMPFDPEGEHLVASILANCANDSELYSAKE